MSDSVRPHRQQPTRLPHPWDSLDKNTGVGCHFLLQCMKVKSESEVAQSCPTLSDPTDCSLPGSSIHGIFQAIVLEWGAFSAARSIHLVCPMFICQDQGLQRLCFDNVLALFITHEHLEVSCGPPFTLLPLSMWR